jgi:hypothetical protein
VLANSKSPKQARDSEHDDLDNLGIYDPDICAEIDCYFDPETGNLWHAYVGDHDIFELMRDTSIAWLEKKYATHSKEEADNHNLDLAIARMESAA